MRAEALAPVFAALGDPTRLALIGRLMGGGALSISALSEGLGLTRQGVTRHLDVLEGAALILRERAGRETLCRVRPGAIEPAYDYLGRARTQWDAAADRLKRFVEVPESLSSEVKPTGPRS